MMSRISVKLFSSWPGTSMMIVFVTRRDGRFTQAELIDAAKDDLSGLAHRAFRESMIPPTP